MYNYMAVELPSFTAEEQEDFLQILKLMRIETAIRTKSGIRVNKADYEAMSNILVEFNLGRMKKT